MSQIYHDNGAAFGRRTRYFRNAAGGGVEWIYAVDHAGGCDRWYGYLATGGHETIASLRISGMDLQPLYATETTPEGAQALVPGVTPITERERTQAQAQRPMRGKAAPCNHGLFDTGARNQLDMF